MNPAAAALLKAQHRLVERLEQLEAQLDAGADDVWRAYAEAAAALAAIVPHTAPGANGALLSTREMAERLSISPKTLLRRRARGQVEAIQLGKRGRAALRWTAGQAR